jgi:Flp pilus assembly protein CpaB
VNGFAVAGTFVDVLFRLHGLVGRPEYPETTFTLLENVEVLAVGQSTDPIPQARSTTMAGRTHVTLGVTPDQANKLKVVEGRGELSLLLRGREADGAPRGLQARDSEREQLKSTLDEIQFALKTLRTEENALRQIQEMAEQRGADFDRQDRLDELVSQIALTEETAADLEMQLTEPAEDADEQTDSVEAIAAPQASRPASDAQSSSAGGLQTYTLASVLGIPAPPTPPDPVPQPIPNPPPSMDIYMGGARQTWVFGGSGVSGQASGSSAQSSSSASPSGSHAGHNHSSSTSTGQPTPAGQAMRAAPKPQKKCATCGSGGASNSVLTSPRRVR